MNQKLILKLSVVQYYVDRYLLIESENEVKDTEELEKAAFRFLDELKAVLDKYPKYKEY